MSENQNQNPTDNTPEVTPVNGVPEAPSITAEPVVEETKPVSEPAVEAKTDAKPEPESADKTEPAPEPAPEPAEKPQSESKPVTPTVIGLTSSTRQKELKTAKNNAVWDACLAFIVIAVCAYLIIHEIQAKDTNNLALVIVDVVLTLYFIYTAIRSYLTIGITRARHQAEDILAKDLIRLATKDAKRVHGNEIPGVPELRKHLKDYLHQHEHEFDLNVDGEASQNLKNLLTYISMLDILLDEEDAVVYKKYAKAAIDHPKALGQIHAMYDSRTEDMNKDDE